MKFKLRKDKSSPPFVKRRNKLLGKLLENCDFNLYLQGNENKPMVIHDNMILDCYVKNFYFYFRYDTENYEKIKIKKNYSKFEKAIIQDRLNSFVKHGKHQLGYILADNHYFVSGWEKHNNLYYPTFSQIYPYVYKEKQIKKLKDKIEIFNFKVINQRLSDYLLNFVFN